MQVHAMMLQKSPASKPEMLWNEDGFIKSGSSFSFQKRQVYKAAPPANIQEDVVRQLLLLHFLELRQYWDLPKVSLSAGRVSYFELTRLF